MNKSIHILLAAAAASALLAGCATRAKGPPVQDLAEAGAQPGAVPAAADPLPGPAVQSAQQLLAAAAGDRVYFALDSDHLDGEARETLRRQADWLAANPGVRARIEGNADERGTREYNLALGARRAAAARQALIAAGVASSRVETISFGKERPLDPGSNEEAWARNRNAGTVVIELASP
ncbi:MULTISPECIES: peptidoglycan-associated lipoprotein Pal [unclassified Phenylobacterium]|uniref:peptidoglycan-associated lipoprotein Pal n=1 Tax=unclassified Phenylobacterium TaxID=2640670 RepID=UPI00083B308E|nr:MULTISPECIES: peptidoglycan-associated lipoprotein Pal [unclassified Phenylobacterium]